MKLLIATRNSHKLREIRAILSDASLSIVGLDEFPDAPEVIEDGDTFDANARKKARELALETGLWTLGDDSGICVDVLGGAPGVYSARYAGEPSNDADNNAKLLRELSGRTDRGAQFRCVLALSDPTGHCRVVEGVCKGRIAEGLSGKEGFGYDPLFIPDGYDVTYAELAPAEKNRISHRGRALACARETWATLLADLG